jgi:hypothetical protein
VVDHSFVGTAPAWDANYHLPAGSVAVNAGDNGLIPLAANFPSLLDLEPELAAIFAHDADGNLRVVDCTVDIGYDEFTGAGACTAGTVVIYDNLYHLSGHSWQPYLQGIYTIGANQFRTDTSTYTLSSMTLRLKPISAPSAITVKLYGDSGSNTIGGELYTIFSGAGPAVAGAATYSGLNYVLAADTKYWIVLENAGGAATTDWTYDGNDVQPAGVGVQPHQNAGCHPGLDCDYAPAYAFGMEVLAESSTALPRPALRLSKNGINYTLSFETRTGLIYQVEYKNSLDAASWTPLPTAPGTGAAVSVTDTNATTQSRFYRAWVQ